MMTIADKGGQGGQAKADNLGQAIITSLEIDTIAYAIFLENTLLGESVHKFHVCLCVCVFYVCVYVCLSPWCNLLLKIGTSSQRHVTCDM